MSGQTDRVVILGRPGEGKTALAAYLLRGWPPDFVWVHDPIRDPYFARYKRCDVDNPPPKKSCLVCLDEADVLAGHKYAAPWVDDLINRGRNHAVSWICCSKRPQKLHRDVNSYFTVTYIFALTGARDLRYVVEEWGDCCQVANDLDQHEFLRVFPKSQRKPATIHRLSPQIIASL